MICTGRVFVRKNKNHYGQVCVWETVHGLFVILFGLGSINNSVTGFLPTGFADPTTIIIFYFFYYLFDQLVTLYFCFLIAIPFILHGL